VNPAGNGAASVADLDRRVLGAGTTLRFVLLAVLIMVSSMYLIWLGAPKRVHNGVVNPKVTCILAVGGEPGDLGPNSSLRLVESGASRAYEDCVRRYQDLPYSWVAGGMGTLFALALLSYWILPHWKRRGGRLISVRDPELMDELAGLARQAGLKTIPDFVIDPVAASPSAVVFGHWYRHTVTLHAGLVARRQAEPDAFRAVVLHELAHIRNGDVGIAYATEALWRAFLVIVLVPYTVLWVFPWPSVKGLGEAVEQWRTDWPEGLRGLFELVILTLLVLMARADVLRTRELYADLDASRWSGARALYGPSAAGVRPKGFRIRATLRRLAGLWRTHPPWAERAESLLDPETLFGVRGTTMFLTGAAANVVVLDVSVIGSNLSLFDTWGDRLTAWTVAAVITGIAGVALWRSTTHAALVGGRIPTGLRAGIWLGLGLAIGELVTFVDAGTGWLPPAPYVLLLLVVGSAALLWWAAQCAEVWIRTCRGRSLRMVHLIGLAVMLTVLGAWFEWWHAEGQLYVGGRPVVAEHAQIVAASLTEGTAAERDALRSFWFAIGFVWELGRTPEFPVGGLLLWLFPLAAWARRPVRHMPLWARRALPQGGLPVGVWVGLPPLRRALVPGVAGGALAVCAVTAVRLWLHAQQGNTEFSQLSATIVTLWLVLALWAAAGLTAIFTYSRAPHPPLPVAFIAAGTSMLIGLAGTFALGASDGCVTSLAFLGSECGWKTSASWALVRYVVGPTTLGLFAVAAVVPLGLALRASINRHGARRHSPPAQLATLVVDDPATATHEGTDKGLWQLLTAAGAGLGVIGELVARLWLHTLRPASTSATWAQRSHEWLGFALTVALAAAVLWALRATRHRRPRSRAMVALATGCAATGTGLASAYVLGASDGCVPYTGVFGLTCAWRPDLAWFPFWYGLVPTWLTLTLTAMSLTVVMAAVWRSTRRNVPLDRPTTQPWPGRVYLTVACVLSLLLITSWWQLLSRSGGAEATAVPLPSTVQQPSPTEARRNRLTAWLVTSGSPLIQDLSKQAGAFAAALDQIAQNQGRIQPKVFAHVCENWVALGHKFLAAPPVPDAPLQALWHQAAQHLVQGGTTCLRGLGNHDIARLNQGLRELDAFRPIFARFINQMPP
jgi:Zn-dependent protease with chaperone function